MHVWMYEMIYKEIEGVGSVYLDDLSDGVWRASVGYVRPGPVLVVHDGVGMAYMGASLYSLPISRRVFLSHSIDLGSLMVSPGGDPILGFSKSRLGMRRAAYMW